MVDIEIAKEHLKNDVIGKAVCDELEIARKMVEELSDNKYEDTLVYYKKLRGE